MSPQLEFVEGRTAWTVPPPESLVVRGRTVTGTSPEGETRSMELGDLIARIAPRRVDTADMVLPDGVKCAIPIPNGVILVHQTPPRVHRFEWIAEDSPAAFGTGTSYRPVRLALPYLIVLAVFNGSAGEVPRLAKSSECFFSVRPLDAEGLETPLLYPALLNCSRFPEDATDKPLSWICVQHLPEDELAGAKTPGGAVHKGVRALLHHLLESGFNLSSENHEVSSWFSETVKAKVDPRVESVEAWENASRGDPLFALDIPWLPTGHTLQQAAGRIGAARNGGGSKFTSGRDLLRVLFRATDTTESKESKGGGDEE